MSCPEKRELYFLALGKAEAGLGDGLAKMDSQQETTDSR